MDALGSCWARSVTVFVGVSTICVFVVCQYYNLILCSERITSDATCVRPELRVTMRKPCLGNISHSVHWVISDRVLT